MTWVIGGALVVVEDLVPGLVHSESEVQVPTSSNGAMIVVDGGLLVEGISLADRLTGEVFGMVVVVVVLEEE